MFVGVIVGLVPLLYLYIKASLRSKSADLQHAVVVLAGGVVLTILSYVSITNTTHEYILSFIVSAIFGFGLMFIIEKDLEHTNKMKEEKGVFEVLEYEKKRFAVVFVIFVIVVILKCCIE